MWQCLSTRLSHILQEEEIENIADPAFPKVQFPTVQDCPSCRGSDGNWNREEVLVFLRHFYPRAEGDAALDANAQATGGGDADVTAQAGTDSNAAKQRTDAHAVLQRGGAQAAAGAGNGQAAGSNGNVKPAAKSSWTWLGLLVAGGALAVILVQLTRYAIVRALLQAHKQRRIFFSCDCVRTNSMSAVVLIPALHVLHLRRAHSSRQNASMPPWSKI